MPPIYYHLGKFPPEAIDWKYLSPITGEACIALGRYDGLLSAIPNAELLLSPLRIKEAVASSSIEGTRVTMSEVLEIEAGASPRATQSQKDDTEEIINYRETLQNCAMEIQRRPISQHMIRLAHGMLMKGVRGRDKSPGTYRKEQNWIGERGCTLQEAGFVPIAPEHLDTGMEAWERYLTRETSINPIAKLAILHVEFEALHPFLDGNGRLGRMLIPLFFYQSNILTGPSFYMSGFLEAHREAYQDAMRAVSKNNDWTGWIEFFAGGVTAQARENTDKAVRILQLYNHMKEEIVRATHSQHAFKTLDFLFRWMFFSTRQFAQFSGIPTSKTAQNILKALADNGIVSLLIKGAGSRPSYYWFKHLRDIVDSSPGGR